jgi:hypothetical protein
MGRIRTYDLPILERERERIRDLGYRIGCADHCTTMVKGDLNKLAYKGSQYEWVRD